MGYLSGDEMKRLFLIIAVLISIVACDQKKQTSHYYETELGYVRWQGFRCELGILTNNDRETVFQDDRKTIKCHPNTVELTEKEFDKSWRERIK